MSTEGKRPWRSGIGWKERRCIGGDDGKAGVSLGIDSLGEV